MGAMTTPPARHTRRTFTRKQLTVITVVAGLVLTAIYAVDRLVLNPWSTSLGGRPALVGHWQGTVDFGPSDRRTIVAKLEHEFAPGNGSGRGKYPKIIGAMKVCGATESQEARLGGDPANRSGSRFELHTAYPSGPGDHLDDLRGEWEGDRITMRARWTTVLPDKTSAQRSEEDARLSFELRRTDKAAFERAC
jgi:hypothetical protein